MPIKVELPVFDGPLDLLLNLIEKNKINIFDIPIVEVTDQYLAYVREMQTEDLGVMSEFMVMAAELIAIKCKMLLPPEVDEEGEEIDPRDELVEQLLEYKMYKYMSYELRDRMTQAEQSLYKPDTTPKEVLSYRPKADPKELLADVTLKKLHEIFDSVLRRQEDKVDPIRSQFGKIEKEEVRLEDKLYEVADIAKRKKKFSFKEILMKQHSRMQTIVTFLAVLELMKYGIIEVRQEETAGDIEIRAVPGADINSVDISGDLEEAPAVQ
ncbi:MAG TPA: segregation/condensation protein A [Lachnospiraceae bacterium]|nr:segregation/condensation protein A [Lachnospiraceae bacterium]